MTNKEIVEEFNKKIQFTPEIPLAGELLLQTLQAKDKAIREMIESKKTAIGKKGRPNKYGFTDNPFATGHNQAIREILSDPLLKEDEK